jgi:hypothetical protein
MDCITAGLKLGMGASPRSKTDRAIEQPKKSRPRPPAHWHHPGRLSRR